LCTALNYSFASDIVKHICGLEGVCQFCLLCKLSFATDFCTAFNYFIEIGYLPTDVLPPPSEEFDEASGIKTVIEYKFNEDGKKVKVLVTLFCLYSQSTVIVTATVICSLITGLIAHYGYCCDIQLGAQAAHLLQYLSASEMTYIVSSGALNSTHYPLLQYLGQLNLHGMLRVSAL